MEKPRNDIQDFLSKINHIEEDKCAFCGKSPGDIRREYMDYMKNPDEDFKCMDIDDLCMMTYKLNKPVCAGCYFHIKGHPKLVVEIMTRTMEEIWL